MMVKSTALTSRSAFGSNELSDVQHPTHGSEMYNLQGRFIWRIIARHRWMILGIVGVTVVLTVLSQVLATPQYRAVATAQVELTDEEGVNQAEAAARNAQRVENEAKIYRSGAVAEHVVRALDLASNAAFAGASAKPRDRVTEQDRARATTKLLKSVQVVSNEKSDLIDIQVELSSPQLAARIANQYPESAQEMRVSRREERRVQLLSGLEKQVNRLAQNVSAAERRVSDFRAQHGMLEGAGGEEDLAQVNRIAAEAASASGMSSAMAAKSAGVSRAMGMRTLAGADSPLLQQQRRDYETLLNERARLGSLFGPGHPDMMRVKNQIAALQANISQEEQRVRAVAAAQASADAAQQSQMAASESAAASARAGSLQGQLQALVSKAFANTRNKVQLSQLERDAQVARDVYLSTHKQAEEVRSLLGVVGVNSTLISPATAPTEPISPTPKKTTAAAFLGSLVLALMLAFAREMLDDKVRSADQVRRWFSLPTFGMFPQVAGLKNSSIEESPVLREPQSLFAEVARAVDSEVHDLATPGLAHTVLVTSPLPEDGKTTVALSLCAAACAVGRRAILIDLDIRRPTILQDIQQRHPEGPDLADMLRDPTRLRLPAPSPEAQEKGDHQMVSYKPVVVSVSEPVKDPAALLTRRRLLPLMDRLRDEYDLIVVNGPAALAVRDARTLSQIADHALMVLRWGHTTIDEVNATLEQMSGKIDAVVFDRVDYAEHARRGYGDAVQFYVDSAPYYSGSVPPSKSWLFKLRRMFNAARPRWQRA